ncbi:heterokaryon incompatibility protein (HET) domain-containing protein [Sarocladium implicatum]|nr:heterokaryon incompatibility protein (HET) domain-containing protein [Sarocladium implicatum]
MRLLNARTFQFKEVQDLRSMPKYAILSHTWTDTEVVYKDMISSPQAAQQRPEFAKVRFAAQQAVDDGLDYVWIDTCNMDKSSSAELSETINSMFSLYKRAEVCYAHLADVAAPPPMEWTDDGHIDDTWTKGFAGARWFTRGWTLQELLAPRTVIFYTKDWKRIGTKRELCQTIARNTGISSMILLGSDFGTTLVAERMSWAAKRKTTRVEDQAYCLLGLFDINMPLLYGEGERAFLRLQHEIIKKTNDRSIFLWQATEESHTSFRNLFARSPEEFRLFDEYNLTACYGRFELTQSGLEIALPLIEIPNTFSPEFFGVIVEDGKYSYCVRLQQVGQGDYLRVDPHETCCIVNPDYNPFRDTNERRTPLQIAIPHALENYAREAYMNYRLGGFHVEHCPVELEISSVEPSDAWNAATNTLEVDFSKSMAPFDDGGRGLNMVFREIADPSVTVKVDFIDAMRTPSGFRISESSSEAYGYVTRVRKRFIGDKMMVVVRIDYQIKEERGMKISSEKNPLPGRYIAYRNPSDEEFAQMVGAESDGPDQEEKDRIEEEEEEEDGQPNGLLEDATPQIEGDKVEKGVDGQDGTAESIS